SPRGRARAGTVDQRSLSVCAMDRGCALARRAGLRRDFRISTFRSRTRRRRTICRGDARQKVRLMRTHGGRAGATAALLRQGARLVGDEAAGTMMTFALLLPVLVAAAGAAIDYSFAASTRSKMQAVADASALASVREMQLARSDSSKI